MRLISSLVLLLSLLPAAAHSQATQVSARFGWLLYDAGGDLNYPMVQLAVERSVSPHVRLGLQGSWAHVGEVSRDWTLPGSDERVLRGVATWAMPSGSPSAAYQCWST